MKFFTKLARTILNFIWKEKEPRIAKMILNNQTTAGGFTIHDFNVY